MKAKIDKRKLVFLVSKGISTEDLNKYYDYSSITDMSYLFAGFKSIKSIPFIDTSNVTNMRYMFSGCKSLETIPLMNTSNVTKMGRMFRNCESLETIPLLDTSKVTSMRYMFEDCDNLINIDPFNFHLYDFSTIKNELFRKKYPELFI